MLRSSCSCAWAQSSSLLVAGAEEDTERRGSEAGKLTFTQLWLNGNTDRGDLEVSIAIL